MKAALGRIQVRGECQVCGRDVAIVKGLVAKHGYEVSHGFFNGTCPGAGEPPYQVAKDRLEWFCARLDKQEADMVAFIASLENGSVERVHEQVYDPATRQRSMVARTALDFPRRNRFGAEETWSRFLDWYAQARKLDLSNFRFHARDPRARLVAWPDRNVALREVPV